ncbi:MAG TPA: ATP-binding protein [Salinivirgaceae bacterium]|nr:ATP-binding protein [Salinivirgaceae bacterium]
MINKKISIAILGPESTGKTELALYLARHFGGVYYEEISRKYVEALNRPYQIDDLDVITNLQIEQYHSMCESDKFFHVFDTEFIITKIWYEWVFKQLPVDFKNILVELRFDLYLLCSPDIPWIPDPVRENGGEARNKLFDEYKNELQRFGYNFRIVEGDGQQRINCALSHLFDVFPVLKNINNCSSTQ